MKQYLLILVFIFLLGCDPTDDRLTIVNESNDDVFYSLSINDTVTNNPVRILDSKDTIWRESNIILTNTFIRHSLIGPNEWEYFINRNCEDSTLRVFIFKKEFILNTSWDSIVAKQTYSKKYKLTVKDLDKLNWRVTYP